jgi:hypothetical protein
MIRALRPIELTMAAIDRGYPGCLDALGAPSPRRISQRSGVAGLIGLLAAGALAGCGISEGGIGTLGVDPGKYALYHCNDLLTRRDALVAKQKELRDLMDKASEGTGGAVIGALAYRTDYETALSEEKLLRRVAAEKKCDLGPPVYQSDQTIR